MKKNTLRGVLKKTICFTIGEIPFCRADSAELCLRKLSGCNANSCRFEVSKVVLAIQRKTIARDLTVGPTSALRDVNYE